MSWLTDILTEYKKRNGGKAISHRPDLAGRVHLLRSTSAADDEVHATSLQDYSDYGGIYGTHIWVRRGVNIIADNLSSVPVTVFDANDEPLPAHPVSQLLAHHNDQHAAPEAWQSWATMMLLAGEAFFEITSDKSGVPRELWARRPDQIGVLPDASRPYYPAAAGYTYLNNVQFEAHEIIHWMFHNPLNPYRGLSLIGAARQGIIIDIFGQAWAKKFLSKGGNPDWALIAPEGITKTEREDYENTITDKFMGYENWHKPIVLEKGIVDIKPLSFPPKDMQWLEQRKLARDEIGAILGVPDVLMGFGGETYDTEEKRKTALRTLWTLTIVPLIKHRDAQLTMFFRKRRPMLNAGEYVGSDLSDIGILQEEIAPKIVGAKTLWDMGVPFNQIDERLGLGIGEIPGGDAGYLPFGIMPSALAGARADAPGSAPAEPPAPQEEQRALPAPVEKVLEAAIAKARAPEYDSIEHRAFAQRVDQIIAPHEDRMSRALKRFFQEQQNRLLRAFREATGEKAVGPDVEVKADIVDIDPPDLPLATQPPLPALASLFVVEEEAAILREALRPIVELAFADSGNAAISLVLGPGAPEWEPINQRVQMAIELLLEAHSEKVTGTTWTGLTGILQQAQQEGASIPEIMEMLNGFFTQRKEPYQVERIARTFMIGAHNSASMEAYSQADGLVYGTWWLAALDKRVRDDHGKKGAHGQFRMLGDPFEVGGELLMYPGDPSASAAQVVNCRCTTKPATQD